MVVEIALEIILQPLKVFLSVWNKNSENLENPKITVSAKCIIESIYKMYHRKHLQKNILSITVLHKLHEFNRN